MKTVSKPLVLAQQNIAALRDYLPRVKSQRVADFVRYLLSVHPADRLPARREIDPLDIPTLLPGLVLTEVERRNGNVRLLMKVAGQDVIEASPVRVAKRYLDEVVTDLAGAEIIVQSRMAVVDTGCSYLRQGRPVMPFNYRMTALEYVHCPLSEDHETVSQIVSCFSYDRLG